MAIEIINKEEENKFPLMRELFGDKRIIALVGEKSSGKSNNLCALVKDFRLHNKNTMIYIYGFDEETTLWIKSFGNVVVVSKLKHFSRKSNSLFLIDECQKLNLGDRRYKKELDDFCDMIYHFERNNWAILCSPNLRTFNKVLGESVERWCVKSLDMDDLVNGSQLKDACESYNGRFRSANILEIPKDILLVMDNEKDIEIELPYIKEVDKKTKNINIFG